MMKRILLPLFIVAVLLCTSCVGKMAFPGQYTYSIDASEDLLKLFRVEAIYAMPDNMAASLVITTPGWTRSFFKNEGEEFYPQMTVRLLAKDGAKNGTLLTKEAYEMSIEFNIEDSKTLKGNGKIIVTKSAGGTKADNEKIPLIGIFNKRQVQLYIEQYDGMVFNFTLDDYK